MKSHFSFRGSRIHGGSRIHVFKNTGGSRIHGGFQNTGGSRKKGLQCKRGSIIMGVPEYKCSRIQGFHENTEVPEYRVSKIQGLKNIKGFQNTGVPEYRGSRNIQSTLFCIKIFCSITL